jgi:Zn-dependent metalloprotease
MKATNLKYKWQVLLAANLFLSCQDGNAPPQPSSIFAIEEAPPSDPSSETLAEVRAIKSLAASRYNDYLASMTDAERDQEAQMADAAGSSGSTLFVEWSGRGVVRSLWSWRMRIPVPAAPACAYAAERVSIFLDRYPELFGLDSPSASLRPERTQPRTGGGTVLRLSETIDGLPVFGAGLVVHVGPEGDIEWLAGLVSPDWAVVPDSDSPTLNAAEAAAVVGGDPAGARLGWLEQEAFDLPIGPLVLAWRITTIDPDAPYFVYLDAHSGLEITRVSQEDNIEREIIYYCNWCEEWELPGTLLCDSRVPSYPCPPPPGYGTSQQIYEHTYDVYHYYMDRYERDGWDDYQFAVGMKASSDTMAQGVCTARWRKIGSYYAPMQTEFDRLLYCGDAVGHEWTHAVDNSEGDLGGGYTQGEALNEAFPDVFAQFIEHYATGTTDWAAGCTETTCGIVRSLSDPGSINKYCNDEWIPYPDNWSNYRSICGPYFNSTIISKSGHLMGREAGEGSETHWGLGVTGIGEVNAGKVWYRALTEQLYGAATFTQFRNAIYSSCAYWHTGTTYYNCLRAVDAIGLWSGDAEAGWSTQYTTSLSRFTVNGEDRRWIFYKVYGGNSIAYRYRTCTITGPCSWSSPFSFDCSSDGPASALYAGYLWVCFRSPYGTNWCDRIYSSGEVHNGPDPGTTLEGPPALAYRSGALYLAYRKSSGYIYWSKYTTSGGWTAEQNTGFVSNTPPALASQSEDPYSSGTRLWLVYSGIDNRVRYSLFNDASGTWGASRLAGRVSTYSQYRPSARMFRGRLHVVSYYMSYPYYMSCAMSCDSASQWTLNVNQGQGLLPYFNLDVYGAQDGRLYLWPRMGDSEILNYRYKSSW